MEEQRFPNKRVFYAKRGGEFSGESDYGVGWRIGPLPGQPQYRVSVVHSTGDVYAHNAYAGDVILINNVGTNGQNEHRVTPFEADPGLPPACADGCAYAAADRVLIDWEEHMATPHSINWLRTRFLPVAQP